MAASTKLRRKSLTSKRPSPTRRTAAAGAQRTRRSNPRAHKGRGVPIMPLLIAPALLILVVAWLIRQSFVTDTLGIAGWLTVGGYTAGATAFTVRWPERAARHWRWLAIGALAVAAAIAWLSVAERSPSYSGDWGYALTRGSAIAAAGYSFIAAFCGGLLFPNTRRVYGTMLRAGAGAGSRGAAVVTFRIRRARQAAPTPIETAVAEMPAEAESPTAAAVPTAVQTTTVPATATATASPTADPSAASAGGMSPVHRRWHLPGTDLLDTPPPTHRPDDINDAMDRMAQAIVSTLQEYCVPVSIETQRAGPRTIRFGLALGQLPRTGTRNKAARVRISDITKHQKELSLALKTPYIRIVEQPEPGESLIGIEIPTPFPTPVMLHSIANSPDFSQLRDTAPLPFALGSDANGQHICLNLATTPHLLIAGATGSGKSVCINTLIASLLLTQTPEQLQLIMIDPKRVELTPYNGIPHLQQPVITDTQQVPLILNQITELMQQRYQILEAAGVRNIAAYHKLITNTNTNSDTNSLPPPMPYLVLIIDELADLMLAKGDHIETQLVQIAQLGRAAGIHTVLATQRPSVNVVTGILKANIPTRIAFAVASGTDSRVILDENGAETLMGKGDLLLSESGPNYPRRGQGALVSDDEIDRIVQHWKLQAHPNTNTATATT